MHDGTDHNLIFGIIISCGIADVNRATVTQSCLIPTYYLPHQYTGLKGNKIILCHMIFVSYSITSLILHLAIHYRLLRGLMV